jgi:hypothetical protein
MDLNLQNKLMEKEKKRSTVKKSINLHARNCKEWIKV